MSQCKDECGVLLKEARENLQSLRLETEVVSDSVEVVEISQAEFDQGVKKNQVCVETSGSKKREKKKRHKPRPSEEEIQAIRARRKAERSEQKGKERVKGEHKPKRAAGKRRYTEKVAFHTTDSYVSLSGQWIDSLGSQPDARVTGPMQAQRVHRDGEGYHITVINHLEVREKTPGLVKPETPKRLVHRLALDSLLNTAQQQFGPALDWELPVDLGLGRCFNEPRTAVSYFRVLCWPFGQHLRQSLGLGFTYFHITCGYSPTDVHQYKGPGTLLCLEKNAHLGQDQAKLLVSVVQHFTHDAEFLNRLYFKLQDQNYTELIDSFAAGVSKRNSN